MSDNPLTDGPLRYVGFSNDLGEALKTLIPRPVYYGSYAIAFGYAALDTGLTYPRAAPEMAVRETARTGVWHLGATIISTPLIIKGVTHKITQLLRPTSLTPLLKTSIPSAVGVFCIPLIVPPIDQAMHLLTNRVFESVDTYLNEKTGTDLHTEAKFNHHWGIYDLFKN